MTSYDVYPEASVIVVRFTKEAMHVEGHAERGRKARLQVCAVVSALMQGLWWSESLRGTDHGFEDYSDLHVVPIRYVGPEFRFVLFALRQLALSHPGNIRVERVPLWLKRRLKRRLSGCFFAPVQVAGL